jgi:hypothetical protein
VSWIHIGTDGGSGGGTVGYSVDANPAAASRSGSIVVAGQTFTVTQAAAPCLYGLSPTSAAVGSGGGGGTLSVTSPIGCAWQATSQASWIHIAGTGSGSGGGAVTYSVDANPAGVSRAGSIAVANQTFAVTQAGVPCTYSLSPTSAAVGSGGGGGTFSITSPIGCAWQATSQASWIHFAGTGSGSGGGAVTYSVDANPAGVSRAGSIAVANQTFAVTQAAAPCTYSLSPTHADVASAGGGGTVSVTAPVGCTWQATSQVSWISTTSSGNGSGSVAYSFDANGAGTSRSGAIDVAGQSFTVSQAAAPCTYSLSPTHADVGSGGGGGTVSITTPTGCTWHATSQASWIGTTSSGDGNGSVTYSVDPNGASTSRSGAIDVAGQSFTVSQDPAVAPTDTLRAGERLYPDQAIRSGSTMLLYQRDNNLVLYQNGSPIWATMAGIGDPTNRFEMQTDCNAVVYSGYGDVWASGTNGQGSSCDARVIEGDWFICSGTTRVFSARGGGTCPTDGSSAMLRQGESLYPGQCRTSPSGVYRLCLQADGDLVIQENGGTIWAANTAGSPGRATLEGNGSLVVYNGGGGAVWETGDVSADLRGPAALLVLDEGDVALDREDNLEAAPPESDGDCEIELYSRVAAGSVIGIHDVVRINYGDGRVDIKSMQDNGDGCRGVTCNDTGIGDGCPEAPEKDARDPYHDTQKTWSRRMPREACVACAAAYDDTIGYAYGLGDSNGAVDDCIREAKKKGMPGKGPTLGRFRHFPRPWFRLGRAYQFPQQDGKSPKGRCTDARDRYGCVFELSPCPTVCGRATGPGKQRLCTWCPSMPECACTPSTSCAQQGAQCGTISNGCGEETCPNSCGPYEGCLGNQCCARAVGECGYAYDECTRGTVYLGNCFSNEVCEDNRCVNPCIEDPCCCGDSVCRNDLYNWCESHGYDDQCCRDLPPRVDLGHDLAPAALASAACSLRAPSSPGPTASALSAPGCRRW